MSQLSGISGWPSSRSSGSQTGDAPVGERALDAVRPGGRHEARVAADQQRAELRHGEAAPAVRGAVVEADALLLAPHAVGEGPAAGHDHGVGRRLRRARLRCRRVAAMRAKLPPTLTIVTLMRRPLPNGAPHDDLHADAAGADLQLLHPHGHARRARVRASTQRADPLGERLDEIDMLLRRRSRGCRR